MNTRNSATERNHLSPALAGKSNPTGETMPLYFLMGTSTSSGRRRLRDNPDLIVESIRDCHCEGADILNQYAVLGQYDFVMLAEADDNDAVARLSLEMSVLAGLQIETLPAIAIRLRGDNEPGAADYEPAYAAAPAAGEWALPNQPPD